MEEKEEERMVRLRREVVSLITSGQISKAMQRVTSHGVASVSDPAVLAQLQSKYPPRGHPLPETVSQRTMCRLSPRFERLLVEAEPRCVTRNWRTQSRVSDCAGRADER